MIIHPHKIFLLLLALSFMLLTGCNSDDDDKEEPEQLYNDNVSVKIADNSFIKSGDKVFQFDTAAITFDITTEDVKLLKGFVISADNQVIRPFKVLSDQGLVLLDNTGFVKPLALKVTP